MIILYGNRLYWRLIDDIICFCRNWKNITLYLLQVFLQYIVWKKGKIRQITLSVSFFIKKYTETGNECWQGLNLPWSYVNCFVYNGSGGALCTILFVPTFSWNCFCDFTSLHAYYRILERLFLLCMNFSVSFIECSSKAKNIRSAKFLQSFGHRGIFPNFLGVLMLFECI